MRDVETLRDTARRAYERGRLLSAARVAWLIAAVTLVSALETGKTYPHDSARIRSVADRHDCAMAFGARLRSCRPRFAIWRRAPRSGVGPMRPRGDCPARHRDRNLRKRWTMRRRALGSGAREERHHALAAMAWRGPRRERDGDAWMPRVRHWHRGWRRGRDGRGRRRCTAHPKTCLSTFGSARELSAALMLLL
jgi:hypothetical protein